MTDATSSMDKISKSEKMALKWCSKLEHKEVNVEIRWSVGSPIYLSWGDGCYNREVLLYPEYDSELFDLIFSKLKDKE